MRSTALQALADDIARDRRVTADEALQLRQQVFPDGVVSRDEAEVLIALSAKVANSDAAWAQCFSEVVCDCMCAGDAVIGDADAAWLMAQFDRPLREFELDALVKVLERANFAPEALAAFVRARFMDFIGDRPMMAADVEMLRRLMYAGDAAVSDDEAQWLFDLDAKTDGRANDASWQDMFVKMQMNHLMGRQPSALLDEAHVKAHMASLHDRKQDVFARLSRIYSGGLGGYFAEVSSAGNREALEDDYWALNENTDEDAKLTKSERNWAERAANADAKLTANERALMAALQKLETAAN